jgi:hypothetical protein
MRRFRAWVAVASAALATSCGGGGLPPIGDPTFKPSQCLSTQFTGDLTGAKEGQHATYVTDNLGHTMTQTFKVVGQDGADWLVEQWIYTGETAYGYLFQLGADAKVRKAWSATRLEKGWTSIPVKEPAAAPSAELPKSKIQESAEKREVEGGAFDCTRVDMIVRLDGKDFPSTTWFSKDAPRLYRGGPHGGLVEMKVAAGHTRLEARGDDARPAFALPGK